MTQQYDLPGRVADIGARIKEARIAIGLSQEDFALRMGRTGRHWAWKVEAGQIGLSAGEIPRAAEMLGRFGAMADRRQGRGVRGRGPRHPPVLPSARVVGLHQRGGRRSSGRA